jgi:hypothetical protein
MESFYLQTNESRAYQILCSHSSVNNEIQLFKILRLLNIDYRSSNGIFDVDEFDPIGRTNQNTSQNEEVMLF